jgi:pimeloyl-ACP methyl ester carboxylesterase
MWLIWNIFDPLLINMLYNKIYLKESTADWVVFIHGAGGSSVVWYKQIQSYSRHFNLLLIDLHGHGKSASGNVNLKYTFENIAQGILKVLDYHKIPQAHFVGVSMGTIIVRKLAGLQKERVKSMILVGAVTKLNLKSRFLVKAGRIFHQIMPYMWLYKALAFVIMPMASSEESRSVFIREARKLARHEFIRWFKLTRRLTAKLQQLESEDPQLPTLYVMGDQDYILLEPVKVIVNACKHKSLAIIDKCGHVVNIEKADIFNELTIDFIRKLNVKPEFSV